MLHSADKYLPVQQLDILLASSIQSLPTLLFLLTITRDKTADVQGRRRLHFPKMTAPGQHCFAGDVVLGFGLGSYGQNPSPWS